MKNKYDKKHLPFGNAFAIEDPVISTFMENLFLNIPTVLQKDNVHNDFTERYRQWIQETKNNIVTGLEHYPHACFTNGTTEAFEKFYAKHSKRRFRTRNKFIRPSFFRRKAGFKRLMWF